jgi:hypothetical protein
VSKVAQVSRKPVARNAATTGPASPGVVRSRASASRALMTWYSSYLERVDGGGCGSQNRPSISAIVYVRYGKYDCGARATAVSASRGRSVSRKAVHTASARRAASSPGAESRTGGVDDAELPPHAASNPTLANARAAPRIVTAHPRTRAILGELGRCPHVPQLHEPRHGP